MRKPKGRAIVERSHRHGGRWDRGLVSLMTIPQWRIRSWVRRGNPVAYMLDRGVAPVFAHKIAAACQAPGGSES